MSARSLMSSLVVAVLFTAVVAPPVRAQAATGIRDVIATARTVIPLHTRLRYTTMIVLPDGEEILDVVCGDKDFWVISAAQNIAHVKPAKEGASTNLNLVAASGAVYSFLLTEKAGGTPDLKVYIKSDEPLAPASTPKYYSAAHVETLQSELTQARTALEAANRHTSEAVASAIQAYRGRLQFVYDLPKATKPLLVQAIWHDGEFT